MATTDDVIKLLASIDASLKALVARMTLPVTAVPRPVPAPARPVTAPTADLDGKYGDPEIKAKDPRDWSGETMRGRRFSQCPAEYLDLIAARLDYFAGKAESDGTLTSSGKPVALFNRADAARARGWAARIRAGYVAQNAPVVGFPSDSPEDIPF